jgi:hypothetical protein
MTSYSSPNYRVSPTCISIIIFLAILISASLAIYQLKPPVSAVPEDGPLMEFSAGRALKHVRNIAAKPHPTGSKENVEVREYLLKELDLLGLKTEVQKSTAVNLDGWGIGTIKNIVARLPGERGNKAILFVAHYDSVPSGPGASDDGASVAAILETLRAIKQGPPLKNDLIVLFTEGEEDGLYGATAFVNEHPWVKDVALTFNFEARGVSGPSWMFQTSDKNNWLIEEFAKAAPSPFANSLANEIYKLTPNDTDFTLFANKGMAGLNFAYIDGFTHYHTKLDSVENLDARSLQHQGDYALALARHFGNLNLDAKGTNNEIYFNIFGAGIIHYSQFWALPLALLILAIFIALIASGLKARRLSIRKIIAGFFLFPLSLIISSGFILLFWYLIEEIHSGYKTFLYGHTYNANFYLIAFISLIALIHSLLSLLFRKRVGRDNLAIGMLIGNLIFMMAASIILPAASYLFTWPLVFSLLSFALLGRTAENEPLSLIRSLLLAGLTVPIIILFAPYIYLIFISLGISLSVVIAPLTVLLLGYLAPQMALMESPNRWLFPTIAGFSCLVFIIIGGLTSGFDSKHPKQNEIYYVLNADSGKAIWGTGNEKLDEWTAQFFKSGHKQGHLPEYFLMSNHYADAPAIEIAAPTLELKDSRQNGELRELRFHINSTAHADRMVINLDNSVKGVEKIIEGKSLGKNINVITYSGVPEDGIDVILKSVPSQPIKLQVINLFYSLPHIDGITPRPNYMMAMPSPAIDSTTWVIKSFTL